MSEHMKPTAKTSAATQAEFDGIGSALAKAGVEVSKMFGMESLKTKGKAFAGLFGDSMVFKLSGTAHGQAMKLKGAKLFDPSGMGRPMKEWVVVPRIHSERWKTLAETAKKYVSGK